MHDNKSGEKKKHLYKETKEMGRCTRYIYMFVLIWAFRKCHIKVKQNVLIFNVKHFAHVCDAVLHMTNNFFVFYFNLRSCVRLQDPYCSWVDDKCAASDRG